MRSIFYVIACLVVLAAAHSTRAEDFDRSITVDGIAREFFVHLPPKAKRPAPIPLLIALHGGGGRARRFARFAGFDTIADREGFAVIYPQGVGRHWNDGRDNIYLAHRRKLDDVGFVRAAIDKLASEISIDPKRVYAAGPSNGGMMALRLACEASRRIAAIAAVIANLPRRLAPRCKPARSVSVLLMNGTADPLIPYTGGYVRFGLMRLGRVLSTTDTVRLWTRRNGCRGAPEKTRLPDRDPDDGTRTRRLAYRVCHGAEVVLYTVEGGGHTWPGGAQYLPDFVIGKTSRDFNASEIIWRFLARQHR